MKFKAHIQPNARKSEVVGLYAGGIKIKIKALPVDGAANEELIGFLSRTLRIPQKNIEICHGHTGKTKLIEIRTEFSEEEILRQLCQAR